MTQAKPKSRGGVLVSNDIRPIVRKLLDVGSPSARSDDPEAATRRICWETPLRGTWTD